MIRALISLPWFVVVTVVMSSLSVLAGVLDRKGEPVLAIARAWSRLVLAAPGVKLKVHMRAPLDPKRPYVFMGNHASMLDIWTAFIAIPVSFRFIAKKSLRLIPILGWAMVAGRFIFIDRQNPARARRSIQLAAERIRAGQSVVIFPEGTRTRDGKLAPFKKGGFHLAIDSGADIVPLAIHGTRALMPPGSPLIRPGRVTLDFGEPIPTAGLAAADRNALVDRVHARVAEMLASPPA